jgi:hypothetical protein
VVFRPRPALVFRPLLRVDARFAVRFEAPARPTDRRWDDLADDERRFPAAPR